MKKIILIIVVAMLSLLTFLYRIEVLSFVKNLEAQSVGNIMMTIGTLIVLKGLFAVIGFPGTPLTLLSGSLLGNLLGTITALVGNTLGATLAFLLARYTLREYVQNMLLAKYPTLKIYEERLERKPLATVIALRLIPLFPFNVLNFLFGLTSVSLKQYIVGSFFGMIPGTFLFVYFGESLRMLSPVNVLFALIGIVLLTYVGKFYEKKF
ncbi:MAG: VTT domain-containing protein [Candidatus Moranbacteria bacterium]|nr:VTT domain-containing protein [Candidatus Moranbacteria bacterium]MDD3965249.1 VTT domain-containing protein [Candidatus Moranbacteria bacterium]